MGAIKLGYSTFGLTGLDFHDALDAIDTAGYEGVEIAFHRNQFNPFNIDDHYLEGVKSHLDQLRIQPGCIATASHFFTPSRPHNPSLITTDLAGRKRRMDLIKRGIHVARQLDVNLVTFGSGFVRPEHQNEAVSPWEILAESIHMLTGEIHDEEDITLLIEPEPGMLVETMEDGLRLVNEVQSSKFKLHVDMCHAYCSEANYIDALAKAAPATRYLHISDAQKGYNLKLVEDQANLNLDLTMASYLIYFPNTADFLLLDPDFPLYFGEKKPEGEQKGRMRDLLKQTGISRLPQWVDYRNLYTGASPLDDEIFTYLISVPHLSFDVLERAHPLLAYLRGVNGAPRRIRQRIANTLTGIVHFHDIPGNGTMDFSASFKALTDNGFSGHGALELYHDVDNWQNALGMSHAYLNPLLKAVRGSTLS